MEFKERLRELRQEAGYSMATLGELIGVSKAAIGNYEAGIRVPRQDQLESLADIFNVDLDYLCCRTDKKRKVSFSENRIIYLMRRLNEDGKNEAVKRVEELTYIPQYVARATKVELNAAHEIPGASAEDKAHDEAIMNDDSEWE